MSAFHNQLQLYLFKNKLNQKSLIEFLTQFSEQTVKSILSDLGLNESKEHKEKLYVFSDGNVKRNGKIDARGGYSVYFGDTLPYSQFNKTKIITSQPTNNKAELLGVKQIFKTIYLNQELFKNKHTIICTDSQYSINCITKWSTEWQRNNWKNSKGEDVKNKQLIKDILSLKDNLDVTLDFKHVFGHTKEPIDKNSLEWMYWYGNFKVDSDINTLLMK